MKNTLPFSKGLQLAIGVIASCIILIALNATDKVPPAAQAETQLQEPQQEAKQGNSLKRPPIISIANQQDTPLQISSVKIHAEDPEQYELIIDLVNKSDRPIRAYTILHDDISGSTRSGGLVSANFVFPESTLKPGKLTKETLEIPNTNIKQVTLSIDFVEFADGSGWGKDKNQSADKFAGYRAGAQATTQRLMNLLNTRGSMAVIEAVKADFADIAHSGGHSTQWVQGFQSGTSFIREYVRRANIAVDPTHMERELRRLDDAMLERR